MLSTQRRVPVGRQPESRSVSTNLPQRCRPHPPVDAGHSEGRLVGIATAIGVSTSGIEGIGFAIPIETVENVLTQLAAGSELRDS